MSDIHNDLNELKIIPELVALHSINPFIAYCSSSRSLMAAQHLAHAVVLDKPETNIIQTGIEKQFSKYTFSKTIKNDSRVVGVIKRYNGMSYNEAKGVAEIVIVYDDLETGMLDYISIPTYHKLHKTFGFNYVIDTKFISSLYKDYVIPANTTIAKTPGITGEGEYGYGLNVNTVYLTLPEVAGDGVIISESLAKKFRYTTYEKIVIECGEDSSPLNMYGDDDNYLIAPEIGEYIRDDNVIMAVRNYDPELALALSGVKEMQECDPNFDTVYYASKSGGKIIDVVVHKNHNDRKRPLTNTTEYLDKYAEGYRRFHRDLLDLTDIGNADYHALTGKYDKRVSPKLASLMKTAYVMTSDKKIKWTHKNAKTDLYRIEFTIAYETDTVPDGNKVTTSHGSKGVIVGIWPDEHMPTNGTVRSDMILHPGSIPGRMNVSNLYEQYLGGSSRKVQQMCRDIVDNYGGIDSISDVGIMEAFEPILGITKIIGNTQYEEYAKIAAVNGDVTTGDANKRREVVTDVYNNELYLFLQISNEKNAYDFTTELRNSPYGVTPEPVSYVTTEGVKTHIENPCIIGPQYILMLTNTTDNYLVTPSAKTNHYGLPVSVSRNNKSRLPWPDKPVKAMSETEVRLYAAYGKPGAASELKDMFNSITTHSKIYETILRSPNPTNIDKLINREEIPYGGDEALKFINNITTPTGFTVGCGTGENKK